jgi:cellulose synthase/poly-beta-1,6-N-acetylglucosamine synthase-like glycosyltransferase
LNDRSEPYVSIIIPCESIDDYAKECVGYCKKLDYGNYESIVLPDDSSEDL